MEVSLTGLGRFPGASDPRLASWLEQVVAALAPEFESFAARFVGDRSMRALNRSFRGLVGSTDVLSFEGATTPEGRHLGDVVISVPYARRQATANGHGLAVELRVLLLHGLLHCLGHDHESDSGEMIRLERGLRRRFIGKPVDRFAGKPASPRAGDRAAA